MRRFRRPKILIVTVAVLVVLLWVVERESSEGPRYRGRHLSYWVELFGQHQLHYLDSGPLFPEGDQLLSEGKQAVIQAGTNALPYLLKWVRYEGPPLRRRLPDRARKFIRQRRKLESRMTSSRELRDEGARIAFRILRTNVTPSTIEELAQLMRATNSPYTATQATRILIELAPAGLEPIAKVIGDPPHPIRPVALQSVFIMASLFGPPGETLVPGLIQCLRDPNRANAELAASALGRLRMSSSVTVPALEACLHSEDAQLKVAAITSLAAFEAQAVPALHVLTNLLTDSDTSVRSAASNAVAVLSAATVTNASLP